MKSGLQPADQLTEFPGRLTGSRDGYDRYGAFGTVCHPEEYRLRTADQLETGEIWKDGV